MNRRDHTLARTISPYDKARGAGRARHTTELIGPCYCLCSSGCPVVYPRDHSLVRARTDRHTVDLADTTTTHAVKH